MTSTSKEVERVLLLVRGGNHVATAVAVAGVSRSTFYRLLDREPELQAELEQARAQAEVAFVEALVREARQRDAAAARLFLERAFPERWGPLPRRRRQPVGW